MSRGWPVFLLLLVGCRFGGPTEAVQTAAPDAAPAVDASSVEVQPDLASDGSVSDVTVSPDGGCQAPFAIVGCDPVCNTGCPALSRCDVGTAPRTGTCVGIWITGEGQACFKGSTTDACAPRLTCLSGLCRRLCYRDTDCAPGACCKNPVDVGSSPSGFSTCAPC